MTAPAAVQPASENGHDGATLCLDELAVRGELPAVLPPCASFTLWPAQLLVVRGSRTWSVSHSAVSAILQQPARNTKHRLQTTIVRIVTPTTLVARAMSTGRSAYSCVPAVVPATKRGRPACSVAGPVRTLDWAGAAEQVQALLQEHAAGAAAEPLLIKGAAAHWPALRKWSLDWLVRHHGRERHGPLAGLLTRGKFFSTATGGASTAVAQYLERQICMRCACPPLQGWRPWNCLVMQIFT